MYQNSAYYKKIKIEIKKISIKKNDIIQKCVKMDSVRVYSYCFTYTMIAN